MRLLRGNYNRGHESGALMMRLVVLEEKETQLWGQREKQLSSSQKEIPHEATNQRCDLELPSLQNSEK